MPTSTARRVSHSTVKTVSGSPVASAANWRITVSWPCPISVKPVLTQISAGLRTTSTVRPNSGSPLPMPVFFTPQATPTCLPAALASS